MVSSGSVLRYNQDRDVSKADEDALLLHLDRAKDRG